MTFLSSERNKVFYVAVFILSKTKIVHYGVRGAKQPSAGVVVRNLKLPRDFN